MPNHIQDAYIFGDLKVKRANSHINQFKAALDQANIIANKGMSVTQQPDGRYVVSLQSLGDIGLLIPLVLGDAVHNLRCVYDHLWMGLWRASGKAGLGTFPFHETRDNLVDALNNSPIKQTFPNIEPFILDRVKPHRDAGGNEMLWAITKLDKLDKHNLILPTVRADRIQSATFTSPRGDNIKFTNVTISGMPNPVSSTVPLKYEQQGKIALDITFPEDGVLARQSVFPTLVNMSQATTETLKAFRENFL